MAPTLREQLVASLHLLGEMEREVITLKLKLKEAKLLEVRLMDEVSMFENRS